MAKKKTKRVGKPIFRTHRERGTKI